PAAVEAELEHLRAALKLAVAHLRGLAEDAAEPELPGELRLGRVAHVVLPDVAVQPVGEVEPAVVERQYEIGDESRYGHGPPLHLLGRHLDDLLHLPLG